jgi:hypothetical protein
MDKLVSLIVMFLTQLKKRQENEGPLLDIKTSTYYGKFNRIEAWQFRESKTPYPPWIAVEQASEGKRYSIPSDSGTKIYVQDKDWITFISGRADKLFSDAEFRNHYKKRRWYVAYAPYMLNVAFGALIGVIFFRPDYVAPVVAPVLQPEKIIVKEPQICPPQKPAEVRYITKEGKTIYKEIITKDLSIEEKLSNLRCAYSEKAVVCRDCTGIDSPDECLTDSFEPVPWSSND